MAYLLQFHPDLAYSKSEDHNGGAIDLWNGEGAYRYYHPLDSSTAAVLVAHGNDSDNDMQHVTAATIIATQQRYWRVLGYFLYAGIESFGSLMVATFWSFANSTLSLQEAESFYGTIIATAQLGTFGWLLYALLNIFHTILLWMGLHSSLCLTSTIPAFCVIFLSPSSAMPFPFQITYFLFRNNYPNEY